MRLTLSLFYFMPVIKHYECADTFNTLKVEIYDDCLLLTTKENDNEIKIFLTRTDLIDLIHELNSINEDLYEIEKGGSHE